MSSIIVGGHSRDVEVDDLWIVLKRLLLYDFFFLFVYIGHVLSNIMRFLF